MNAVIALCHFCESHGPCAVFCTQTLRDTKIEDISFDRSVLKNCAACESIGKSVSIISKDDESNANFLSTQVPIIQEVVSLVKQASVRSLSCEVGCNKDGGLVFFGDSSRGHVLSHTFHIKDIQARGFHRLFSIVILMKDKLFLLNIQPFLADNLKKISQELQDFAQKVYSAEQAQASSGRDQSIASGQIPVQAPRSLSELTAERDIFAILHSHFTWILWAGARCLTESVTFGSLPWMNAEGEQSVISPEEKSIEETVYNANDTEFFSLRYAKEALRSQFKEVFYCALVGIQVVVRGPPTGSQTLALLMCLKKILPDKMHKLTHFNCSTYISSPDYRIITVSTEVAVPQVCPTVLRIDIVDNTHSVKWLGEIPSKCPDLLTKIVKAVDEKLFNDIVLDKQIKVLIHDWQTKISCINNVKSTADLTKLKKILGIQQHDQLLVNYWSTYLH